MLLGKKSKSPVESEWAVILDRSPNELLKNRAMEKLSEAFSVSSDEAHELLENTPIILLDNLSFESAEKVRSFFSEAGVNCSLTKDTFTKRKCFRAVWPAEPRIGHLIGGSDSELLDDFDEPQVPEPSLPTLSGARDPSEYVPQTSFSDSSDEDEKRLRDLTLELQRENELLHTQLEKTEESVKDREQKRYGIEIERLQAERLRNEDLISSLRSENRALNSKIEEITQEVRMLSAARSEVEDLKRMLAEAQENSVAKSQFAELRVQLERLKTENLKFQSSVRLAQTEAKRYQTEWLETQKTLSQARAEMEDLKRMLAQAQESALSRPQVTELKTQLEHYRNEFTKAQSAIRAAQSETKQYQAEWVQARKALSEARTEAEEMKRALDQVQVDTSRIREEAERIRLEAENRLHTYTSEVEEWKRKANDWSASYFKVVKENEFLRAQQSEEMENLKERNQQISVQLEQAQKQIREFASQMEQQEIVQKRLKATTQLSEQESRLKSLVQKQQTLEGEIRLREEELKSVLSEQQLVEQDVVKSKQIQKHLIEQAKLKEKGRFTRPKGSGQNPGFIAPPMD